MIKVFEDKGKFYQRHLDKFLVTKIFISTKKYRLLHSNVKRVLLSLVSENVFEITLTYLEKYYFFIVTNDSELNTIIETEIYIEIKQCFCWAKPLRLSQVCKIT